MPLWLCNKCCHEWEGDRSSDVCDWCGSRGKVIEEETQLERFLGDGMFNQVLDGALTGLRVAAKLTKADPEDQKRERLKIMKEKLTEFMRNDIDPKV